MRAVAHDGSLILCTRPEGSRWWRNLERNPDVTLRLQGRSVSAHAAVLDPHSDEALAGLRAFVTRNPRTGTMLYHVSPGPDGRPVESDLVREVKRSVVVRLTIERQPSVHA